MYEAEIFSTCRRGLYHSLVDRSFYILALCEVGRARAPEKNTKIIVFSPFKGLLYALIWQHWPILPVIAMIINTDNKNYDSI